MTSRFLVSLYDFSTPNTATARKTRYSASFYSEAPSAAKSSDRSHASAHHS